MGFSHCPSFFMCFFYFMSKSKGIFNCSQLLHADFSLDAEVLGKPFLPLVLFLHSLCACAQVSWALAHSRQLRLWHWLISVFSCFVISWIHKLHFIELLPLFKWPQIQITKEENRNKENRFLKNAPELINILLFLNFSTTNQVGLWK